MTNDDKATAIHALAALDEDGMRKVLADMDESTEEDVLATLARTRVDSYRNGLEATESLPSRYAELREKRARRELNLRELGAQIRKLSVHLGKPKRLILPAEIQALDDILLVRAPGSRGGLLLGRIGADDAGRGGQEYFSAETVPGDYGSIFTFIPKATWPALRGQVEALAARGTIVIVEDVLGFDFETFVAEHASWFENGLSWALGFCTSERMLWRARGPLDGRGAAVGLFACACAARLADLGGADNRAHKRFWATATKATQDDAIAPLGAA